METLARNFSQKQLNELFNLNYDHYYLTFYKLKYIYNVFISLETRVNTFWEGVNASLWEKNKEFTSTLPKFCLKQPDNKPKFPFLRSRNFDTTSRAHRTHQLVEDGQLVGVGQEGAVALRRGGERSSVHAAEHVGERARRTELCAGSAAAREPLTLRRVDLPDVLVAQLRERHAGRWRDWGPGKKSAAVTQSDGTASISTFLFFSFFFTVSACVRNKRWRPARGRLYFQ